MRVPSRLASAFTQWTAKPSREGRPRGARLQVFCRILSDCAGAEWPLSRKFGCEREWPWTCSKCPELGLEPHGVSFMLAPSSVTSMPGTVRSRLRRPCSRNAASAA